MQAIDRGFAFVVGHEPAGLRLLGLHFGRDRRAEAAEVALDVFRLPKPVGEGDSFEIDEQHHMALLYWVKRLAYDTQDADAFDRRKSEDYEAKFRGYCAQARVEQTRARRQVGSTQYGGL